MPGSPASNLGLAPGDIITKMAGKDVGTDGTMKDYCDVLRTKGEDAAIGVEVLRFDTSEVLRGEFNGKELTQAFSFADELGSGATGAGSTYDSFSIVTDDSNTIQVEVPDEWTDVRGGTQTIAGVQAPSIQASPDVNQFLNSFDVPGMEFVLSDQFTSADFETILDSVGPSEFCTSDGRQDYSDPLFTGRFEVWKDCQGTSAQYIVLVASAARLEPGRDRDSAGDRRSRLRRARPHPQHVQHDRHRPQAEPRHDGRLIGVDGAHQRSTARRLADAARPQLRSHGRADARARRRRRVRARAEPTE